MATKKEVVVKRKFKRPSALADKPEVKKKVAMAKKPSEHEKISLVLDETHIELTDEDIPQDSPERQELAEELFQEPSPSTEGSEEEAEESADEEVQPTVEEKEKSDAVLNQASNSAEATVDDQAKVDEMVNQSAVVDQPASEDEDEKGEEEEAPVERPMQTASNSAVVVEESNSLRWVLVLIILFLVGLMGGLFYFFILQNKPVEKPKSALKTVAVYTPSPTPASVVKNAFTIKVLNGSGVAGQAASVQTMLTNAGYKVVDVDNADNSNYTKTEIQAKDTVSKAFLTTLEQSLSDKYTVDTTVSPTTSSETDDVVIIIGSSTK